MATGTLPISTLTPHEINVPITYEENSHITSIREYFRYSRYGKLVIVDFGGIFFDVTAMVEVDCTNLPTIGNRFVVRLFADTTQTTSITQEGFAYANTSGLAKQIRFVCPANTAMYGQAVYITN